MPRAKQIAVSASTTRTGVHHGCRPACSPIGPPTLSLAASTNGSSTDGCTRVSPASSVKAGVLLARELLLPLVQRLTIAAATAPAVLLTGRERALGVRRLRVARVVGGRRPGRRPGDGRVGRTGRTG